MGFHVTSATTINRPLEEVFYYVTNSENDPEWWLGVRESKRISEVKRGVGTRYHQVVAFLGRKFDNYFEVTEYEEPRRMKWKGGETMFPFEAEIFFDPVESGTRVRIEADLAVPRAFRLIEPI